MRLFRSNNLGHGLEDKLKLFFYVLFLIDFFLNLILLPCPCWELQFIIYFSWGYLYLMTRIAGLIG